MLAFSNDYYGMIFRATQSVELFCAYDISKIILIKYFLQDFTPPSSLHQFSLVLVRLFYSYFLLTYFSLQPNPQKQLSL